MSQPLPKLLTIAEVAKWMRISRMSVYRKINAGELRSLRVGDKTLRIPEAALTEYLSKKGNDMTGILRTDE